MTLIERFLARVAYNGPIRKGPGPCWRWCGLIKDGYGIFPHHGEGSTLAHRFGYEAFVGPVPEGQKLMNICGDRSCPNPEHWKPRAK